MEIADKLNRKGYNITHHEATGHSKALSRENNAASFQRSREILANNRRRNRELLRREFNESIGFGPKEKITPEAIEAKRKALYSRLEKSKDPIDVSDLSNDMADALAEYQSLPSYRPNVDEKVELDKLEKVLASYENIVADQGYQLKPMDYIKLHQAITRQRRELMQKGMTREEGEVFDKVLQSLDRAGDKYTGQGMKEFRQARELYRAEMNLGVGSGDAIDPLTGKLSIEKMVKNLKANDERGFVRNGNVGLLYERLRQFNALNGLTEDDIPGLGREVSTSAYSTVLRPIFEAYNTRQINKYLYDPAWRPVYPAGWAAKTAITPGLLQATQTEAGPIGIFKEEFLNPSGEQP